MSWFADLTGFSESKESVRKNLIVDGTTMVSKANGRQMQIGTLTTPTLGELRDQANATRSDEIGELVVTEVVGDVQAMHQEPENAGALFQVASQFNLLEMVSPTVTPEAGVTGYEGDRTQGPACAIACGAGTIYRNWFVDIDGKRGQTHERQLDMLADVGAALGNDGGKLWSMSNGYALATGHGLATLPSSHDDLRIGVQTNCEVTIGDTGHEVNQAYCSALPVAYTSGVSPQRLEPLARMILNSAYAATMWAARRQRAAGGSDRVYLTLLGGGVFGNDIEWILDAMQLSFDAHRDVALDVRIVSHGQSNRALAPLLTHS